MESDWINSDTFREFMRDPVKFVEKVLEHAQQRQQERENEMVTTADEIRNKQFIEDLRNQGRGKLVELLEQVEFDKDSGVKRHEGRDIIIPQDMDLAQAIENIKAAENDQQTETVSSHRFNWAYHDVLNALDNAIKAIFGFGVQKHIDMGIFGRRPPETEPVVVGLDERGDPISKQLPKGKIGLPGLYEPENDLGYIYINGNIRRTELSAYVRKKHQHIIQNLVDLTRRNLSTDSIYKGKIINSKMEFIHLGDFDVNSLVLNRYVRKTLEDNIMLPILNRDLADRVGVEPRRSALLFGPYGTGKSMFLRELALRASQADWTVFINSDTDDMAQMLHMAKIYQPSVIQIEDVDARIGSNRGRDMNELLNQLDGAFGKQDHVVTVMTSNNPGRIHEAALRPGRISLAVEFGGLDGQGMERLMGQCGLEFHDDIKWDKLAEEYDVLMPCYIKETSNRIGLTHQIGNGGVSEDDVRAALEGMMGHYRLAQQAAKGNYEPTAEDLLLQRITEELPSVMDAWWNER